MAVQRDTQVEGLWSSGLLKLLIATPELAWATDAGQAVVVAELTACLSPCPRPLCDFHGTDAESLVAPLVVIKGTQRFVPVPGM